MNTFFWGQNKIAALNVITVGNTGFNNGQASPYSYNNNGDCLFFSTTNPTNDVTSVSYGGVAMTQIGTPTLFSTFGRYCTLWILVNPPQGVNNFVYNGASANMYKGFVSMKGVNQTTPYNNYTQTSATSANPVITSLATSIDNTYIFNMLVSAGTPTAGTDTTLVLNVVGAASYYFMKTTPVATAGTTGSINITNTSSAYMSKLIQLNPK